MDRVEDAGIVGMSPVKEPRGLRLRRFHAASAALIGLFLAFHVANHLVGVFGEHRHIAFMAAGRRLYRFLLIEAALIALLTWQAISGVAMVIRGWRVRYGPIAWAQAAGGSYLALFLLIHVSAVLTGRANGIDTDFRFAAQGMHIGLAWFFVPYYFFAIVALFTHLGCAAYWLAQARGAPARPAIVLIAVAAGGVVGVLIIASLAGAFFTVHPQVMIR